MACYCGLKHEIGEFCVSGSYNCETVSVRKALSGEHSTATTTLAELLHRPLTSDENNLPVCSLCSVIYNELSGRIHRHGVRTPLSQL